MPVAAREPTLRCGRMLVAPGLLLLMSVLGAGCSRDHTVGQDPKLDAVQPSADDASKPHASDAAAPNSGAEGSASGDSAAASSEGAAENAAAAQPKRPKKAKVRTIHPLSPTRHDCLEMVSFCTGEPRRCTSAPIHVACGEEVEVKSRKEWLRCECP